MSRTHGLDFVAVKLNDHRLKPGGVPDSWGWVCSCEVERPPAEGWEDEKVADDSLLTSRRDPLLPIGGQTEWFSTGEPTVGDPSAY